MKFSIDNHTTAPATLEDFILIVYTLIDDLYQLHAPPSIAKRKQIHRSRLSDSEIITIAICGELVGIDSENAWFSFVKRNFSSLFPSLCSRSRFNRTRRALMQVTELLRQKLLSGFSVLSRRYFIADSFPLAVCKFGRACFCRSFRGYGADYGRCPSKKETYFGYKVHALVTLDGFITTFEITPASVDDREGLLDMITDRSDITILGDKGYIGENLSNDLKNQRVCLMALKRSNSKENWPSDVRQLIFRLRRKVETVFSQLSEQLNAERVRAKSFEGLCTRMVNKILAHNVSMVLNQLFGKNCDITQIKHLIF